MAGTRSGRVKDVEDEKEKLVEVEKREGKGREGKGREGDTLTTQMRMKTGCIPKLSIIAPITGKPMRALTDQEV